jgi:hypothetical protein
MITISFFKPILIKKPQQSKMTYKKPPCYPCDRTFVLSDFICVSGSFTYVSVGFCTALQEVAKRNKRRMVGESLKYTTFVPGIFH